MLRGAGRDSNPAAVAGRLQGRRSTAREGSVCSAGAPGSRCHVGVSSTQFTQHPQEQAHQVPDLQHVGVVHVDQLRHVPPADAVKVDLCTAGRAGDMGER